MRNVGHRMARNRGEAVAFAIVLLAATAAGAIVSAHAQANRTRPAYSTSNLVRLHIIANSDSGEDQRIKLAVRDRLIDKFTPVFKGVGDVDEAEYLIRENLHLIEEEAAEVVRRAGKEYGARAMVGRFPFPPRVYGQLALPAGEYRALRVVLGNGEGQNWWCVMFPPLCFVDVATSGEGVPDATAKTRVKSFVLEWLRGRNGTGLAVGGRTR